MHSVDPTTEQMIRSVLAYAENRLRLDPVPLDEGSRDPAELDAALGGCSATSRTTRTRCSAPTPRVWPRR